MKLPKPPADTEDPKAPKSPWERIITSTPVVMTVLATLLAGLSSSEMTQSQYYRSLAAQNQSKAVGQWSYFQAKKQRSTEAANAADVIANLGDSGPLSLDVFTAAAARFASRLEAVSQSSPSFKAAAARAQSLRTRIEAVDSEQERKAVQTMAAPLPPPPELKIDDEATRKAYEVLAGGKEEWTDPAVFRAVTEKALRDAHHNAAENSSAADAELKPVIDGIANLKKLLDDLAGAAGIIRTMAAPASQAASRPAADATVVNASDRGAPPELRQLNADFVVAQKRFDANRLEREARINQQSGYLYELNVRQTSLAADRHLIRSRYFFFGMIAAQAAVVLASLSLAVKERSWLWIIAATVGLLAVSYAGYVYMFT